MGLIWYRSHSKRRVIDGLDIVTQGLLGATLAQAAAKKNEVKIAALIGFAAGMLADADALIQSSEDPLLYLEFHRHFTHSLLFIPVGGFLAALILWPLLRRHLSFKRIYLFSVLAYATSGLLDACTSYGTTLFWPVSEERVAWSVVAIVDPVFSLILVVAIVWGVRKAKPLAARLGLLLVSCYLVLGVYQQQRAYDAAIALAEQRGHVVDRLVVKPTMANNILWRSIYEADGVFYVDGIRVGWFSPDKVYFGQNAARFDVERDMPELMHDSVLSHDIERFRYFSNEFVILDTRRENVLIDVRYSMLPTTLTPLWGIDMNVKSKDEHVRFVQYRDTSPDTREQFTAMVLGR